MNIKNNVSTAFLVSLLIVVLFVGVWQMEIKPAQATSTFGYYSSGNQEWSDANYLHGTNYTLTEQANITSISVYLFAGDASGLKVAIYNQSAGLPDHVIVNGTGTAAAAEAWYTVTIVATTLEPDAYYLLFIQESNRYVSSVAGGEGYGGMGKAKTYTDDWTDPWTEGAVSNSYRYSIYASYDIPTTTAPTYSNFQVAGQKESALTNISVKWTTTDTLNVSIFCWNTSGSYVNDSQALSGLQAWHNFSDTLPVAGSIIRCWYWCNNTLNEWTRTDNVTFAVFDDDMALYVNGNQTRNGNGTVILRGVCYNLFIDDGRGSWQDATGTVHWNTWDTDLVDLNLDTMKSWNINFIRVAATVEWWLLNSSGFITNLKYFIEGARTRGMYVALTFWRVNGTGPQDSLPYPPVSKNNGYITSVGDFVNLWENVSQTLQSYSNLVYDFWNEPDVEYSSSWSTTLNLIVGEVRNCSSNLVAQAKRIGVDFDNYGSGSMWDMNYGISADTINDPLGNILVSPHLYRASFYHYNTPAYQVYSVSDMTWALNLTKVINWTALPYPVWVGEIGCNLWVSDLANETAWFTNTLAILKNYSAAYTMWEWRWTGAQWGAFQASVANFDPSISGQILIDSLAGATEVVLTISSPENVTYTSALISVSLSASGGTIDKIWWNCKNGSSWIYVSNQTYTVPVDMTGFVIGTSYTFYAWANNTLGDVDGKTVMFTVEITVFTDWGGYWGRWWGYP